MGMENTAENREKFLGTIPLGRMARNLMMLQMPPFISLVMKPNLLQVLLLKWMAVEQFNLNKPFQVKCVYLMHP